MWVKLGNEYLNLDQVVRIRFNKAFRAGHEEWAAEVEGLIKGELQLLTRYRGAEAMALQSALTPHLTSHATPGAVAIQVMETAATSGGQAMTGTIPDFKLP